MPIGSIILQPAADSLNAAYRPIVLQVAATGTGGGAPPVVYCDIYVNGTYYKSQEKTQPNGSNWQFDVQDACQEILKSVIALNGGNTVVPASSSFATISCKFRSSGFDGDGFITPEDTAPVQGTGSTSPVAGTGTESNSFYVVNSTLQHDQNQDLEAHLNSYKQGSWASDAYPLSHRGSLQGGPDYRICQDDSDYFPIAYKGSGTLSCLVVNYTMKDGTTGSLSDCGAGAGACPALTGVVISEEQFGPDQMFHFAWNTPDPLLTSIGIQYRIDGTADPFTTVNGSTASGRTLLLPLGLYEFRFQMNGACESSTSINYPHHGIEAPVCEAVSISGSPDLPGAVTSAPYSYSIALAGTAPFSLSAITKPAWMSIDLSGSNVNLSGTPALGDAGTSIAVGFTATNDCGTVDFADTIDVIVLEKTFTLTLGAPHSLSPLFVGQFNSPVDVDVEINTIFADGYTAADCSLPVAQSMTANNIPIPAGSYAGSASGSPGTGWTTLQSFSIYGVFITVTGGYVGAVFPGDVITMGSYSVTILFDGC